MDDVRLPMLRGTMDDISQEGEGVDSQDTPMDSMSSQGAKAIYEKEANLEIDYISLSEDYKEVGASVEW